MGTRIKDFESRAHYEQQFAGDGVILGPIKRRGEDFLRVVVEGVGETNEIQPQGRLLGQTNWQNIGSAITDVSEGVSVDISNYDEWRLSCTTYEADGSPKVIVSGFFN